MSITNVLAIVNPIAAPLLPSSAAWFAAPLGAGSTAPFAAIGTLGNVESRIRGHIRGNPALVDHGLYVIASRDGQSFYHGKGDGLMKRLGARRLCAENLGYKPHDHAVAIWIAPSKATPLRALEERINTRLLARNATLPRSGALRANNKNRELEAPESPGNAGAFSTFIQESTMHPMTCRCTRCRHNTSAELEVLEFEKRDAGESEFELEFEFESSDESAYESTHEGAMDDVREYELALELLSVSSEEELDQFLGKLVRGAWKGLKKVGSAVGKIAKPLGGVLRSVAKTALPFVGGALGSFIPIPGVGTMIGRAVGQAVSSALEAETAGLEPEARDLEMARRFVRIADTAARQAAGAVTRGVEPVRAVQQAVASAARQQVPGMKPLQGQGSAVGQSASSMGRARRWVRRGNTIVVHGV